MDGDASGRIKCTLANWTGVAYKIPRTEIEKCKNREDLKWIGEYFLFGVSNDTWRISLTQNSQVSRKTERIYFTAQATAKQIADGFVVQKGNKLSPSRGADDTISPGKHKKREESKIIDKTYLI